jgi:hypothetical protein
MKPEAEEMVKSTEELMMRGTKMKNQRCAQRMAIRLTRPALNKRKKPDSSSHTSCFVLTSEQKALCARIETVTNIERAERSQRWAAL